MCIQTFAISKSGYVFLLMSYFSSIYTFWVLAPYQMAGGKYFIPIVDYLLIVPFAV
jgi:hypothetical protein